MAIHWRWDECCGEAVTKQDFDGEEKFFTKKLYVGNAYLIFLNEWEEDGKNMYSMYTFWVDKDHMKRCLGLDKKFTDENMLNDGLTKLVKIRLNKSKCRYYKQIITALVEAFDELEIELFTEEEKE